MPSERVREYEIEYSGVRSRIGTGWAAYLTVYDSSANRVFRSRLIPTQRVCVDRVFPTQADAESAARIRGLSLAGVRM